jgi:hypothetical protein
MLKNILLVQLLCVLSQQIVAAPTAVEQVNSQIPGINFSYTIKPPFETYLDKATLQLEGLQLPFKSPEEFKNAIQLFAELEGVVAKSLQEITTAINSMSAENIGEVQNKFIKLNQLIKLLNQHKEKSPALNVFETLSKARTLNNLLVIMNDAAFATYALSSSIVGTINELIVSNNEILNFQLNVLTASYLSETVEKTQIETLKSILGKVSNATSEFEQQYSYYEYALNARASNLKPYSTSRIGFTSLSEEISANKEQIKAMLAPLTVTISMLQKFLNALEYTPWGGNKKFVPATASNKCEFLRL